MENEDKIQLEYVGLEKQEKTDKEIEKTSKLEIIKKWLNPNLTFRDLALAAMILALWIVTEKFLTINLGVTRISWYFAWTIIIGLKYKPIFGIPFVIMGDSIKLAFTGNIWLWTYAIIPPLIYLVAYLMRKVTEIENAKIWWTISVLFAMLLPLGIGIYMLVDQYTGSYFDSLFKKTGSVNSYTFSLSPNNVKIFIWSFLALYTITQIVLFILYMFKKTEKLKRIISVQIITSMVIVLFKIIWGPFAFMSFTGGIIQGIQDNKYAVYLIPRIITSPISIVIYSYIVYSITSVWNQIDKGHNGW